MIESQVLATILAELDWAHAGWILIILYLCSGDFRHLVNRYFGIKPRDAMRSELILQFSDMLRNHDTENKRDFQKMGDQMKEYHDDLSEKMAKLSHEIAHMKGYSKGRRNGTKETG